jgi:hypothetical protein
MALSLRRKQLAIKRAPGASVCCAAVGRIVPQSNGRSLVARFW